MTTPRGLSRPPTSFIGSWCQGIHRAPLPTYPLHTTTPRHHHPPEPAPHEGGTTRSRQQPNGARSTVRTCQASTHKTSPLTTRHHHASRGPTQAKCTTKHIILRCSQPLSTTQTPPGTRRPTPRPHPHHGERVSGPAPTGHTRDNRTCVRVPSGPDSVCLCRTPDHHPPGPADGTRTPGQAGPRAVWKRCEFQTGECHPTEHPEHHLRGPVSRVCRLRVVPLDTTRHPRPGLIPRRHD